MLMQARHAFFLFASLHLVSIRCHEMMLTLSCFYVLLFKLQLYHFRVLTWYAICNDCAWMLLTLSTFCAQTPFRCLSPLLHITSICICLLCHGFSKEEACRCSDVHQREHEPVLASQPQTGRRSRGRSRRGEASTRVLLFNVCPKLVLNPQA